MKKLMYILAAGTTLLAACQPGNSYKVTGAVDGLNDGDTVYLKKAENMALVAIDSTVVANGTFAFTGVTDTTEMHYVTYVSNGRPARVPFYLEKGNINLAVSPEGDSKVTGTPTNEVFNTYNLKQKEAYTEMREIYASIVNDSTLTEEARKEKMGVLDEKQNEFSAYVKEYMKANMTNQVGLYLFAQEYAYMEIAEAEEILAMIPANLQESEQVTDIKEQLENMKKTAVGQKYIDFEMQTPEGETVKLSDFISKNKVTLIDFWASWCGPCRAEMPNVVKAYKAYQKKGFGIVGVSLDNSAEAWKKAIKDLNITWPQMSDLKGWQCEGAKLYAVRGIPATFMIDQEGTIIAKDLRGEAITEKLAEILK